MAAGLLHTTKHRKPDQQKMSTRHMRYASVIGLILKPENSTYLCAADASSKNLETSRLLSLIARQHPRITVLIDVGAQVLDMTNQEVASAWLEEDSNAKCVLFFNDEDEATVLDRRSIVVPLRISPYRNKLDECLIYLDEVHTRGIDLQMPSGIKAAVTLGPRLVKDRLVQGKPLSKVQKYSRKGSDILCSMLENAKAGLRSFIDLLRAARGPSKYPTTHQQTNRRVELTRRHFMDDRADLQCYGDVRVAETDTRSSFSADERYAKTS